MNTNMMMIEYGWDWTIEPMAKFKNRGSIAQIIRIEIEQNPE